MARLKKKVLGQVSGAVGDIVFREKYGNNYLGMRPGSFMPGTSYSDHQRRQRFALAEKLVYQLILLQNSKHSGQALHLLDYLLSIIL